MTLVIGAGLAGWRLAHALDRGWAAEGQVEPLVLFGRVGGFDKIALGEWATGVRDEAPVLDGSWVRDQSRLVTVAIDQVSLPERTATDANGTVYPWDRLVFALGSEAIVPPTFSSPSPRIFPLSSPEGADRLRAALKVPAQSLLVVGGGPLGVETAWNLARRGHRVTLVHRGDRLLGPFLDPEGSQRVDAHWRASGVEVRLGAREQSFDETPIGCRVSFDGGTGWEGDAVVIACGTRPLTDLARRTGLAVGEGGIEVDDQGQTSHPGVYAVGDCATAPGEVPGLWEPARRRVDRLVALWTRKPAPVAAGAPVFRLKTEWPVVSRGDPGARGRTTHVGVAGGDWKAVETPDGLAFWQVLGDHPDLEPRIASLEGGTVLLAPAHAGAAVDWPDGHVVCDCHQIPVSAVRRAWADGARSLGEVGRRTQAGTSCGNCHPRLLDLSAKSGVGVRWSRAYRRPRSRGWSWRDILGYVIDYGMLVTGLLTALTGVLKMPGFLEAVGLDQRSLPDEANMALSALLDLHDWPGIALTVLALVHAALHWGMMTTFAKSWFRKR